MQRRSLSVLKAPAVIAGLDDVAMMRDAVEESGGHLGIAEHGGPFPERQIGGDDDAGLLVKLANQMEQNCPPERANGR